MNQRDLDHFLQRLKLAADSVADAMNERDLLIRVLAEGRVKQVELAKATGLTKARIHQIVRAPSSPTSRRASASETAR